MSQPRIEHTPPEHFAEAGIRLNDLTMEIEIRSVVDDKEKPSSRDGIFGINCWGDKNRII
jgi:hypothetical protein